MRPPRLVLYGLAALVVSGGLLHWSRLTDDLRAAGRTEARAAERQALTHRLRLATDSVRALAARNRALEAAYVARRAETRVQDDTTLVVGTIPLVVPAPVVARIVTADALVDGLQRQVAGLEGVIQDQGRVIATYQADSADAAARIRALTRRRPGFKTGAAVGAGAVAVLVWLAGSVVK